MVRQKVTASDMIRASVALKRGLSRKLPKASIDQLYHTLRKTCTIGLKLPIPEGLKDTVLKEVFEAFMLVGMKKEGAIAGSLISDLLEVADDDWAAKFLSEIDWMVADSISIDCPMVSCPLCVVGPILISRKAYDRGIATCPVKADRVQLT